MPIARRHTVGHENIRLRWRALAARNVGCRMAAYRRRDDLETIRNGTAEPSPRLAVASSALRYPHHYPATYRYVAGLVGRFGAARVASDAAYQFSARRRWLAVALAAKSRAGT